MALQTQVQHIEHGSLLLYQVAGCQLTDASLIPQPTGCFWQDGADANQTLVLQKQLQNSQATVQQLTTQKADFQAIVDKQMGMRLQRP